MLILSRKPGDAILIDGGIRVVVIACDGGGVRLGIEAPASIGIVREEIARDIADENIRAGATPEHRTFLEALEPRAVKRSTPPPATPGTPLPEEASPARTPEQSAPRSAEPDTEG
jgi:carbon storage regulator